MPDAQLEGLIASQMLLAQLWPLACEEVKMFIQLLRMSMPSLAEALAVGLITMRIPPAATISADVTLEYGSTILTAVASGQAGDPVPAPHLRPGEVWRLSITDLSVSGHSALRRAG
jgi:hypothetical protein